MSTMQCTPGFMKTILSVSSLHQQPVCGIPLMWAPWGPGDVSCIERCPHFRGKFLIREHVWDIHVAKYL